MGVVNRGDEGADVEDALAEQIDSSPSTWARIAASPLLGTVVGIPEALAALRRRHERGPDEPLDPPADPDDLFG